MIRSGLCTALFGALLLCAGSAAAEPPAAGAAPSGEAPGAAAAPRGQEAGPKSPAEEREGEYETSTTGRKYRVRFDPASRISFTAGLTGLHDGEGGAIVTFEAGLRLGYRKVYDYVPGEDRVLWQVDHQFPSGVVRPLVRHAGDVPSFDATVYRVTLLRHSESPSIVLPLSPPLTIGFPFDVGLDMEFGRFEVPPLAVALPGFAVRQPWLHAGVVRSTFTLDPWRTGERGRALALGVGVRYDVDVYGAPTLGQPRFVHRVAPLTSGSARFRYQTDDTLWWIDAFAEAAPHWTSENRWDLLANVSVRVDRTLIAINDQPVSAFADVGYRYLPEGAGAPALHDVRATAGVAMSISLR